MEKTTSHYLISQKLEKFTSCHCLLDENSGHELLAGKWITTRSDLCPILGFRGNLADQHNLPSS